jgi:transcriptional regulator with XRE-family HTH domain
MYEEECIKTGQIIVKYREKLNLTQKELAEKTGIKLVRIKRYETGDCAKMPNNEIVILCRFFGVTMEYLMGGSDTKAWRFTIGNFTYESDSYDFSKSCLNFVKEFIDKGIIKMEEIKYE